MKNLNICIDIDGTITDAYFWLEEANKYFNKSVTVDQVTEYFIHKVMNVEKLEYEKFYKKNKFKIHSKQELREDVKISLKKLSMLHNVYFVTARDKSLTMLTHSYLKKNDLYYDDLFVLGSHYKVEKAKELNCNIFIEDSYDNAMQLSKAGFKVLLMDTNYNRGKLNENIIRVYNWKEIYEKINKLLLHNKAM
ncbi:hypothetical protein [Clostridium sp.]|jgi:uncharacterized HAD superfamily protein|uniref:hypothetical protein n=1 Tax=Clostridium sp. TaxID=1506 RepID=UPI003EE9D9FF